MTESDRQAFTAGFLRMCACFSKPFDPQQCAAYFESPLRLKSLPSVLEAMEQATLAAGRFFPSVGLIAEVLSDRSGPGRETSHAPAVERDEHGKVIVRYRCVFCADSGWRPVLTATGQALSEAELQAWECSDDRPAGPREDGRPHVIRRRCACKAQGAAA